MPETIRTGKVASRRKLRFDSLEQCVAEVDRLCAAERAGRAQTLGNWSLGQNLNHLAQWIDYSFDGAPMRTKWFVKVLIKYFVGKNGFINEPMPAGVKIPGVAGGTLATDAVSLDEGEHRFRRAVERLKLSSPTIPHMVFGPMTHEEWIKLHLRHSELHLGFVCEK